MVLRRSGAGGEGGKLPAFEIEAKSSHIFVAVGKALSEGEECLICGYGCKTGRALSRGRMGWDICAVS